MKRNRFTRYSSIVLLVLGAFATANVAYAAGTALTCAGHQHVNVTNVQKAPLRNIAINFSGDSADFSQTNNCRKILGKGQSCTIHISFLPQTPGSKNATLEVQTSGGSQAVRLTGTGI